MATPEHILTAAAERFGVDPQSIAPQDRAAAGPFYTCRRGSSACTLRVHAMPEERAPGFAAKVAFAHYLAENGIPITGPVPSLEGALYEVFPADAGVYFAILTPAAFGRQASARNPYFWNTDLFSAWGALVGRLHALAKGCPEQISAGMPDWRHEMDAFAALASGEPKVLARWQALREPLETLTADGASFGPVLNDLHQWNFRYHPDRPGPCPITITEFDAAVTHWFACDLAVPLYHATTEAVHGAVAERQAFTRAFLRPFFDGYLRENDLDPAWLERLPLFLSYREILVYLALSKEWPEGRRAPWQRNFLAGKRARILRNEPLVGHISL